MKRTKSVSPSTHAASPRDVARTASKARTPRLRCSRRALLGWATGVAFPAVWVPNPVFAQQCSGRGGVKHLVYVRLSGGFRFTTAFNADVGDQFNPFGKASGVAGGTEWGVGRLLEAADWLDGPDATAVRELGMRRVTEFSNEMMVLATVDHEPTAGNADGNHGTGLERFLTGYPGGTTSFFTMIHYGLRERIAAAAADGRVELPPFVLGSTGMAQGYGAYAGYRPPLIQGDSFDQFSFSTGSKLPSWATQMAAEADRNMKERQVMATRALVDTYIGTRESTERFAEIFSSDLLRIRNASDEQVDGISNRQLAALFGDSGTARRIRLALRLFHFGCPAVFLDQGSYDLHSNEDEALPREMVGLARLLSGLNAALKRMSHPAGGTYWDHTLVVLGSEFGRTARGSRFNSAGGSDHGGDRATRWMSMPMMGGFVTQNGLGGKQFGATDRSDLKDDGAVYSYRSVCKTLMDLLCADHAEFFEQDSVISTIF